MRLAQVKALNSFTFSDCLNYLNYSWSDIYSRMAMIDDGYYGVNVRLTSKLTRLPPFIKNTVQIYAAQSPTDYARDVFRSAGTGDLGAASTYRISGHDLYCPDAERRIVWMYYVPACPQVFFTMYNRDPKIFTFPSVTDTSAYGDATGIDHFDLNDFYTYGKQSDRYNYQTLKGYKLKKYTNVAYNNDDHQWYSYNTGNDDPSYTYALLDPQPAGQLKKYDDIPLTVDNYTHYSAAYFSDTPAVLAKVENSWYKGEYTFTNVARNKDTNLWYTFAEDTYTIMEVQPNGDWYNAVNPTEDGDYIKYESVSFYALKGFSFGDYSKVDYWEFYDRRLQEPIDITDNLLSPIKDRDDKDLWFISFISCEYPYIFITFTNKELNENVSGFYTKDWDWSEYNPFEFTGHTSNVQYLRCAWNDKTGLGVLVRDYNEVKPSEIQNMDLSYVQYEAPVLKEMGWTPDTISR